MLTEAQPMITLSTVLAPVSALGAGQRELSVNDRASFA